MSSSKKLPVKGLFGLRQVVICLFQTLYVYTVYVFTQGRGGGVEPERRLEGQQFTKLGQKL